MLEKDRINELIEVVMKVAEGDYSAQVELSGKNDELDSLAMGLNMMIDDIRNEITEREKAEERIEHINAILLAIRNVNQLIAKERDRDKLLKGACENLIETRGYYDAWIALLDESGMLVTTAEAGLGEDFLPVVEWLKSGKLTVCSQKALKRKEVISIVDPSSTCADCPLAGKYIDKGAMSIRLEYGRKIYGLLSVSVPRDFVSDEEEKALFSEIAGDIAFALYNIEVEEERKKVEEALQKRTHDLDERVKELSCLYGIDEMCRKEGATIEEVLKKVPQIIPPSLQYLDSTESCITFEGNKYKSRNFKKTKWIQSADIIIRKEKIGLVEVCYLEEKPKRDEGPFLKEERDLINAVAERLSQFIGHKQAEADLKNSEERYRDLVEKAGIAILIDDENGNITYANKKAEELYGYSLKELKNQSIQSLVHSDDIKKVAQFHNDRLRGKEAPSSYEFKGIKKDGSIIYVELDVVELKVKERAIGTRLYLKDITERKQAEELLRTSEAQLSNAMQIARLGNWEYDVVSDLFTFNDHFYAIFRTTADKVGGYTMSPARYTELFLYPDDKAVVAIEMKKAFEAVDPYFSRQLEHRIVYADGNIGWISVRFFIVKDDHGRTVKTYGVNQDITERKKAEEKIEKSLKEKEVLLKEIHHRVKNNMQIISSLLNIQSANIEDENMREVFNVCQSRIRSMALMHETLYKSEDLARIDFSEYIRRLTTHLMSMYREGIEPIRLNLDIVDVYLDINRAIPCGMIINELVSNSLKHAFPDGKGGEIAVKMFTDKKKIVTLIVSDTGVGFPEGLDFRETKSMGMQLVTDLTRQIKGTIKIGRDKGTEFKIVF
ncbi:MAG: PAS domain S-box protein [Candidatus Aminicenantes bacterium]|nr:PAS domain S-box protein [Candidatus Aminicenantes bacterium]MBL7083219.1 PAS domain S-box protein [Candidatus Aminicenantes bacterium]